MRIGVTCSAGDGGKSGISTYLKQIIGNMAKVNCSDELYLFIGSDDDFLEEVIPKNAVVHRISGLFAKPVTNIFWHLFLLPILCWWYRLDVLFLPAGNRRLTLWAPCEAVATVHDLSQLHVSNKYDGFRLFYVLRLLPYLMRRMSRIITVSESTALDVRKYAKVENDHISVVHNGIDRSNYQPQKEGKDRERLSRRYGIDSPYILYTSRLEHPGKNHLRLLEAFERIQKENEHLSKFKLVCVGAPWPGAEAIFQRVEELDLEEQVIFTGYADYEDLPRLYSCAECFVFPSLFEGFGLPLLEAMSCHVPVACSNVSSLPEVAGEAAEYFDPEKPEAIAEAILNVCSCHERAEELVRLGKKRVAHFSWARCAQETISTIKNTSGGEAWIAVPERR